jgi:hypothetical protein
LQISDELYTFAQTGSETENAKDKNDPPVKTAAIFLAKIDAELKACRNIAFAFDVTQTPSVEAMSKQLSNPVAGTA